MRWCAILTACLITGAAPAFAAPTGEDSARDQLKAKEAELAEAKAREAEVSGKAEAVNKELTELQGKLVTIAAKVQENERSLSETENSLALLTRQLAEKTALLAQRRSQLAGMIGAAVRLSQTPPEAAIMMPGDFQNTISAARVLSTLQATIREETKGIADELEELTTLKRKVEDTRAQAQREQKSLKEEQKVMDARVAERKKLYKQLNRQQNELKQDVDQLAREAKDLQDLIVSLEKQHEAPAPKEKKTEAKKQSGKKLRSFANAKGKIRAPVQGRIRYRFAQRIERNETSKGMTVITRAKARVVAPYDGEVVFSGNFMNYGNIVILRHSDDFHTLLAGLGTIDVSVGEFLLEGEPIGAMDDDPKGEEFYLELRKNNQPVDPAPWMPPAQSSR